VKRLAAVLLLAACGAAAAQDAPTHAQREQRFARERDAEAALLHVAQEEVRRQEAAVAAARERSDAARRAAAGDERRLAAATRALDTLYDAARGAVVDLHDMAAASLVTAQFPQRMDVLAPLVAATGRPGAAELERIWQALEFDAAQSGRVVAFTAPVATGEGVVEREVLRAGVFAAVADGEYLLPGSRGLEPMQAQPPRGLRRIARAFAQSGEGVAPMALDPARGALLLAEARRPGLFERLWHSGVGGYFLAGVVLLAVGLAAAQALWLRTRLILDEHSIGVVAGALAAFALVQGWLWAPREGNAREEPVAYVDLVGGDAPAGEGVPAPEAEPPPAPPAPALPEPAAVALPAPAVPTSGIRLPVQVAGGSLTGAGFGGFARDGAAAWGRGQGFKGRELVPLSTARPQMPEWACRQRIKGWVEAVFTVLPNGRVQDVRIVDAQPRGVYEVAAIESISHWIYAVSESAREVKQRVPMDPADCAYNWR
jgi:protein TonB